MRKFTSLCIGDLHVGDRWAIAPVGFQTSLGHKHQLNMGQRFVLECFRDMSERLPQRVDLLVVDGDVIQGNRRARDIWEPDPVFQARAAAQLLSPLAKRARKVYVLRGTEWHSGEGGQAAELVGEKLGAESDGSSYCWPWLHLDIGGIHVDVSHHQSVMTRYRTSSLAREIQFAALIAEWGGRADVIIRGHSHHFLCMNIEGDVGVSLPGWQLQNVFLQMSKMPSRRFAKWLGAVRIDFYPEKKTEPPQDAGEYIKIMPLLYAHPGLRSQALIKEKINGKT